jgi:hypothetical protein
LPEDRRGAPPGVGQAPTRAPPPAFSSPKQSAVVASPSAKVLPPHPSCLASGSAATGDVPACGSRTYDFGASSLQISAVVETHEEQRVARVGTRPPASTVKIATLSPSCELRVPRRTPTIHAPVSSLRSAPERSPLPE